MLISTGMASLEEIEDALGSIGEITDADILLFHCISSYPTPTSRISFGKSISFLKTNSA